MMPFVRTICRITFVAEAGDDDEDDDDDDDEFEVGRNGCDCCCCNWHLMSSIGVKNMDDANPATQPQMTGLTSEAAPVSFSPSISISLLFMLLLLLLLLLLLRPPDANRSS
jgi:hypothetical protein